jgi:hypothetical protein
LLFSTTIDIGCKTPAQTFSGSTVAVRLGLKQPIKRLLESYGRRAREDREIDILRRVCDYLSYGTNGPWFMVLDNADDRDIWLGPAARGAVLAMSTTPLVRLVLNQHLLNSSIEDGLALESAKCA